jgi:hypothetical protein
VEGVRSLGGLPLVLGAVAQRVCDPDSFDDKDLVLEVDLSLGLRGQSPLARIDPARLQRATKGAGESTGGRGHDVIERRGVFRVLTRRGAVVLAHGPMRAKDHRPVFGREERLANGSALADDPYL